MLSYHLLKTSLIIASVHSNTKLAYMRTVKGKGWVTALYEI
jgi:hypothetical protein